MTTDQFAELMAELRLHRELLEKLVNPIRSGPISPITYCGGCGGIWYNGHVCYGYGSVMDPGNDHSTAVSVTQ